MTPDVDVLILGAGLSGIGAAAHLTRERPGTAYAILEQRAELGGRWDLFRYPGVRSDSDMYTLGYDFRPWHGASMLATGAEILDYITATARDYGVLEHIRYRHEAYAAHWSSADSMWTVRARHTDEDGVSSEREITTRFLYSCAGYYDYAGGHSVDLPGEDPIAKAATALPGRAAYALTRWGHILQTWGLYQFSRKRPETMRRFIAGEARKLVPPGYPVDVHFKPTYAPWDQRLCLAPEGDDAADRPDQPVCLAAPGLPGPARVHAGVAADAATGDADPAIDRYLGGLHPAG